jgi:uncharacterized protein YdiU (UPF0061 family)
LDHRKFYPHIEGENKVLSWFREVVQRTAFLMVEWQRVGFVHGVMNTDNMSILGLTIDYGPYSFVDNYDINFTPNTTDLPGRRYAFGRQPAVAKWNLACLAGAIARLINDDEKLAGTLEEYDDFYWTNYYAMMGKKLGLDKLGSKDPKLIDELEKFLKTAKPDLTIFFQLLITVPPEVEDKEQVVDHFKQSFYSDLNEQQAAELFNFITRHQTRIEANTITRAESQQVMRATSPRFILRNYLLHEAIQGLEKGDDTLFFKLHEAMKEPYSDKHDEFFERRPEWATQQAGCSMLSCSS